MITTLYAALLALLYLGLSLSVMHGRWKHRVGLGDGGNKDMIKRIRMHGNFAEYVPLALLLMFMLDMARFSPVMIHVLGIMLVVARISHVIGIRRSQYFTPARGIGVVLTLLVILIAAVSLLWVFFAMRVTGF